MLLFILLSEISSYDFELVEMLIGVFCFMLIFVVVCIFVEVFVCFEFFMIFGEFFVGVFIGVLGLYFLVLLEI